MLGRRSWAGASAVAIARAVQRGQVSATAVVADHIEHAHVAKRVLDPLRTLRDGAAIVEAEQVDQQPTLGHLYLAGVPVVVAENTPIAGLPTWNGSAGARRDVARHDHEVVRRLRGAGAVVVGTGRIAELGLWSVTDDASAATRNPWRGDRSAGGAAGGSAAAVAAGVAAIAHGTDALGSVRIPAACCGLVGFKPGNEYGFVEENAVLATTVDDAALGFAVITGRLPHRCAQHRRLRIAVSWRGPIPAPRPDADTTAALRHTARVLVGLGHDVTGDEPPYPARLWGMQLGAWAAMAHAEAAAVDAAGLQPRTRRLLSVASWASRRGPVRAGERADFRARCVQWFVNGGLDVLVLPATAGRVPAAAHWSARSLWANAAVSAGLFAYTAPWNLAGLPAMTVPMGVRRDGLPAAVQLVGSPGGEELLLAVAAQIEAVAPWRRHAPGWPRDVARHRAGVRGTIRV